MSNIRIENETPYRKDLERRRESKYLLTGWDVGKIRRLLEQKTHRQVHNREVSVVRSIYFDDARLSACYANIDGLGQRTKLRLRWYDSPKPLNECFLEVKWRDSNITGKHRFRIQDNRPIGELSYREIHEQLLRAMPDSHVGYVLRYPDPIVIVEYRREHFISPDRSVRATIDYDLAFYDQMGKRQINIGFKQRVPEFLVLESKTAVGLESEIRRLVHPIPLRATRCSKYVYGCKSLGMISNHHI